MRQRGTEQIALTWLILSGQFTQCFADGIINQLTYSGTELLALRDGEFYHRQDYSTTCPGSYIGITALVIVVMGRRGRGVREAA